MLTSFWMNFLKASYFLLMLSMAFMTLVLWLIFSVIEDHVFWFMNKLGDDCVVAFELYKIFYGVWHVNLLHNLSACGVCRKVFGIIRLFFLFAMHMWLWAVLPLIIQSIHLFLKVLLLIQSYFSSASMIFLPIYFNASNFMLTILFLMLVFWAIPLF